MTDLVIYGLGPFARLMRFYFASDSEYRVVAFTADEEFITDRCFWGLPVVPLSSVRQEFPPEGASMFVAIGYRKMRNRQILFQRAKAMGYALANYVSSAAVHYPGLKMGENNVLMANVTVEPFVTMGNNNVFWTGTLVCHDAVVGHHNYAAARCIIGGACVVRDGCFLGNGSILIDHLEIASETHVGPGATVLRSTREFRRYMGNPAREVGSHEEHGIVIERS
jgi:UDP-N-acetylbacillosamine N-acetyltransferase